MLTITPPAAQALQASLDHVDASNTRAVRVQADAGTDQRLAIRLAIDEVMPDDKKVEFQGRVILVARPDVAELLSDRTLSVEETDSTAAFRLRPTETAGEAKVSTNGDA